MTRMQYRPDVDGLRSIAVLLVVLFHGQFTLKGTPFLPSGFLGVDVFFVISGYLIFGIVHKEIGASEFSYRRFFERRFRRIVPALAVVLLACLVQAWIILSPAQMAEFSMSGAAASLFLSNIWFWSQAGYFDKAAELKPLLHTWSLGVEMQFYILFPLILVALRKRSLPQVRMWLGGLACASFLVCLLTTPVSSDTSFYWLPFRAWELIVGALAATFYVRIGWLFASAASLCSLSMILLPSTLTTAISGHPGMITLLPVFGAAALLCLGANGSLISKMLSWRPLVWGGVLSYSFYLWHWPLLAFLRLTSEGEPSSSQKAVAIFVALGFACLSYWFVESPGRRQANFRWLKSAVAGATIVMLVVAAASAMTNGLAFRFGEAGWINTRLERGFFVNGQDCFHSNCVIGAKVGPLKVILKGDSHAGVFVTSLNDALTGLNIGGLTLADEDMLVQRFPDYYRNAEARNKGLLKHWGIIRGSDADVVILSARHTLRVLNAPFDNGEGGVERNASATGRSAEQVHELLTDIEVAVLELVRLGKKVILIDPIPEVGWDVPEALAMRRAAGNFEPITTSREVYDKRNEAIIELFAKLDRLPNVERVIVANLLCNEQRCTTEINGEILYFDTDHLTKAGADIVMVQIVNMLRQMLHINDAGMALPSKAG
jgi:peptidoglycan/LPS O-acetylase OafA/YrhL